MEDFVLVCSCVPLGILTVSPFLYLSVDTYAASMSWLVNNAAVNIGAHISCQMIVFPFSVDHIKKESYWVVG